MAAHCQVCLWLLFALPLWQHFAGAIPLDNNLAIPIILAVDPPAPNGTTTSSAEQRDFDAVLGNSTISAIAADSATNSSSSTPAALQMNSLGNTTATPTMAPSSTTAGTNAANAANDVPGPERGNGTSPATPIQAVAAKDSGEQQTTNGPSSSSSTQSSTSTTTTTAPTTTQSGTTGGGPSGALVEVAANPAAVPAPAAASKNAAAPPAQMSLQAINVPPSQSNSAEQNSSTPQSPTNFAQLGSSPLFAAQQSCTSADCSGNGSCIGIRGMPVCFCNAGYTGSRCQAEVCNPAENCNSRGWCVGTITQFSCFCQLGFSGNQCQTQNGRR